MLEFFYFIIFHISAFYVIAILAFLFDRSVEKGPRHLHSPIFALLIFMLSMCWSGFMLIKLDDEIQRTENAEHLYALCVEYHKLSECKKVSSVTFENQQNLSVMESCIKNQKNTVDGCLEGLKSTYRFMPEEQELKKEIEPPSNKSASISIRVSSAWGASEFIYSGDWER